MWTFLISNSAAYSQNTYMFSQFENAKGLFNPAFTGRSDCINGIVISRAQWMGMEGAPVLHGINMHFPVPKHNSTAGFTIVNEKMGMRNYFNTAVSFAMSFRTGASSHLSFGLQTGILGFHFDKSKAVLTDAGFDPFFEGNNAFYVLPDVSFGAYYRNAGYFAGLSLPRILLDDFNFTEKKFTIDRLSFKYQHIYLNTGYLFPINEFVDIKPALMIKYLPATPAQYCLLARMQFEKSLGFGLGWRINESVHLYTGYHISDNLGIYYSYDLTVNKLSGYNSGSHEFCIKFNFGESAKKPVIIDSIRDF